MRSRHTFRKNDDRLDSTGTSPVGCRSLGTALSLAATAQIAGGAFIVGLPVEMARLLRAGSWGNEKNLSICSTAALLVRGSTAASTVHRAADR